MGFTDAEDAPEKVLQVLENIGPSTFRKTIPETLDLISRRITAALNGQGDEDDDDDDSADIVMTDTEDAMNIKWDEGSDASDFFQDIEHNLDYGQDLDDIHFGIASHALPRPGNLSVKISSTASIRQLKRDLCDARDAGYKIGLPPNTKTDTVPDYFSVSQRVSLLGLPEEILDAWGMQITDYVVLLIKLPGGYPTREEYYADSTSMQFILGKCPKYKPSGTSARAAFRATKARDSNSARGADLGAWAVSDGDMSQFSALYISNSLERYMSTGFKGILEIRSSARVTWETAKKMHKLLSSGNHRRANDEAKGLAEADQLKSLREDEEGKTRSDTLGDELNRAAIDDELAGIPRLAMDFALLHLVTSTTMCMVCHKKVDHAFEAVKPYVCDNRLCEFQYMELGFGPSIEHDIIQQPYVVDLLVGFCFAALNSGQTRGIPQSLNTKVPAPPYRLRSASIVPLVTPTWGIGDADAQAPASPPAELSPKSPLHEVDVEDTYLGFRDPMTKPQLRIGDLFVLIRLPSSPRGGFKYQQIQHCRTRLVEFGGIQFDVIASESLQGNVLANTSEDEIDRKAHLFLYDQNLCDLEPVDRVEAIIAILQTIPSVTQMREYLLQNPGCRLGSWSGVTQPALDILRWIVASNRSHIVQLDRPARTGSLVAEETIDDGIAVRSNEKVKGVEDTWLQFRFAQGSPAKEERFYQELTQHTTGQLFPTLFAWHGSPLKNWHNIIREGLTFSERNITNGRAYGHGVYFAKDFGISSGYSQMHNFYHQYWQNSQLKIASAISLCEILNRPEMFISKEPYYVVDKVDWIQCRYLIVKMQEATINSALLGVPSLPARVPGADGDPQESQEDDSNTKDYINQDPRRQVTGPSKAAVQIPLSVLPRSRRGARGDEQGAASKLHRSKLETEPEVMDAKDAAYLHLNDDEGGNTPRENENTDSLRVESTTATQVVCAIPGVPPLTV
jgi:ubiquitin-conjugating enzyme E2 Q